MTSDVADARFRAMHALRIKGFAKVEVVAEVADLDPDVVSDVLHALAADDLAAFREARSLWQLTPAGRSAHGAALGAAAADGARTLSGACADFLKLNERFKELCGQWQMRDGQPNDHDDPAYDRGVVDQLAALHDDTRPVLSALTEALPRLGPYSRRLERTCRRVLEGENNMFTGVMCGSYHDVWMELHEDLILTQGIHRPSEESF